MTTNMKQKHKRILVNDDDDDRFNNEMIKFPFIPN